LRRLVESALLQWHGADRRKPLILRGARQVGKTWTVERFGRAHFKEMVKVDLEKRRDVHGVFEGNLGSKTVLAQLSVAFGRRITPGETLLFLDEIQTCPRALMALRYLYEEVPALHVIAAGSLLEFALGEISFPVGRVQFLNMYPLTFAEFVLAVGNEPLFDVLQRSPTALPAATHRVILEHLRNYFFVGGMPEAVAAFRDGASLLDAFDVQAEIIEAYRQDFGKYAPRADKQALDRVLASCAARVGERIKYSTLAEGYSNPTLHKAFDLLCMAQVVQRIPAVSNPALPLAASANARKFKAAVVDIGLMQRLSHVPVDVEIRHENLLSIYRGKLAEQFVAQELTVLQNRELYYWAREERGSTAEVDYLLHKQGDVYPIEVKSGEGGTMRSMHLFLKAYPKVKQGIVLYGGTYGERLEEKLRFVPLYFAGSLCA
jgi:predicted AAA+ superfamily ATPase